MTIKKKSGKKASLMLLKPREIGAAEFKARCLELMDEVERLGIEIVVTKHRKPVARLVPMPNRRGVCGSLEGTIIEEDDIVSPIDAEWGADESNLA
jgi:prevent-host-death family protein